MSAVNLKGRGVAGALLAVALLLVAALIGLASGMSQSVTWRPAVQAPQTPRPSSAPAHVPDLPDEQLQIAWQRPLFSTDRSPDVSTPLAGATRLEGLSLGGVILDGTSQWALLRKQDKRVLKLKPGDALDNGWTLSQLTPSTATFTRQGQSQRLSLPVLRLPPATTLHTPPNPTSPLLSAP